MRFKNRFWGRLFGLKQEGDIDGEALEQLVPEEESGQEGQLPLSEAESDINRLTFHGEHPFIRLYELWADQVKNAPYPCLRMENGEDSSGNELMEEAERLRKAITEAAAARLEQIPEVTEPDPSSRESEPGSLSGEPEPDPSSKAAEGTSEEMAPPAKMDALPLVYVTADEMAAWLIVFPPVGDGKELERSMLDDILKKSGVTFGVDTALLDRLPDAPDRYFHLFLIAGGKAVVHGKDGYIEDFFRRTVERQFIEDENGNADYLNLNLVQNVEKGQAICQAIPPEEGIPGRTVLDKEIPFRPGKAAVLPKGRNTKISEDGTKLLAVKTGRVEFSGRSFLVKTILEISGNVDGTTGNINYVGDIHIHGDVSSGFTVRTIGSITVDGVVEAAEIEAGGDLIIQKGISGDSRAMIRSHHDIYAKYMESCTVHCRGNLQTSCIINSNVYCDGEVHVCTGRGTIIGGQIHAAQGIYAKIVGSRTESVAALYLGGQPCADFEREVLQQNIKTQEADLEKLERQPDSPSKTQRIGKLRLDLAVGRMKLGQFDKELKKLEEKLEEQGGSRLKCDIAYPGMALTIGEEILHLTKETSCVNARLVNGEICLM